MSIDSTIRLNNGVEIPRLGFGVYLAARGEETERAVLAALSAGYRHIDTARIYENEGDVGVAIRDSDVPRSELFVTTKLWNDDHGYDETLRAFDASLDLLGLEYLDLFLIHWPVPEKRSDSWRAMERLAEEGRVRALGVSNYMVHHLEELLAAAKVVPAVNQIELHPYLQQDALVAACKDAGIAVTGYSPLGSPDSAAMMGRDDDILLTEHPTIMQIAESHGATPGQVLIGWALARGTSVIPKSVNPGRIAENWAARDLSLTTADMTAIAALDRHQRKVDGSFWFLGETYSPQTLWDE